MKYLSLDIRALALMRMCIAAIVLFDLGIRMTDLEVFYTDRGVMPLTMLFEHAWNPYFISFHSISGLWQVQALLFLFSFFCGIMLFIGYRTRLFTFLSWLMMLSLHNRNEMILQGGDDLLRMMLFWGMFLPWGAKYSCDQIMDGAAIRAERTIITAATIAYLFQLCYIYTGSALLKGPEWDTHYTALYYAYNLDQICYPVTKYLANQPALLKTLTMIVYYFELFVPVLFFIPLKHQWCRMIAVGSIVFFHAANACTLFIGLFPFIGMATVLGVLPSMAMDYLERISFRIRRHIKASFMGISFFVNKLIRWKRPVYVFPKWRERIRMAALIFLIFFVFDWNFSNLTFIHSKLSDRLRFIGYGLRLDQNWGMFSPGVFKDDGWFVLEGETDTGQLIDLLTGKAPDYSKPEHIVFMFRNDRWRKYSENLIFAEHEFMRGYYCNYRRRIWDEKHPAQKIKKLRVVYMEEFTLPDYQYSVPQKNVLWECY